MKIIIWFIGIIVAISLLLVFGLSKINNASAWNQEYSKINICHKTGSESHPYEAIQVDDNGYLNGHPDDFLYQGPVKDNGKPTKEGNDWCDEHVPPVDQCPDEDGVQPTGPCEQPKDYCDTLEGIQTEDTDCPPKEEEPPVESTPEAVVPPVEHHDELSAHVEPPCADSKPGSLTITSIDTGVPNDGKVTVNWTSSDPKGSTVHIKYSDSDGDWKWALLNTPNDGSEEIGELTNGQSHFFTAAQVNGCAVGDFSKSVDPMP